MQDHFTLIFLMHEMNHPIQHTITKHAVANFTLNSLIQKSVDLTLIHHTI